VLVLLSIFIIIFLVRKFRVWMKYLELCPVRLHVPYFMRIKMNFSFFKFYILNHDSYYWTGFN